MFRVQGSGFKVQGFGLGLRVLGLNPEILSPNPQNLKAQPWLQLPGPDPDFANGFAQIGGPGSRDSKV